MVWRKKHRPGQRKRERIAVLKQPATSSQTERDVNYVEQRSELNTPTVRASGARLEQWKASRHRLLWVAVVNRNVGKRDALNDDFYRIRKPNHHETHHNWRWDLNLWVQRQTVQQSEWRFQGKARPNRVKQSNSKIKTSHYFLRLSWSCAQKVSSAG